MIQYIMSAGSDILKNFIFFSKTMILIIPFVFVLIGLFEVWVKRETIEKHLGNESDLMGYFWAILLSMTTVGGVFVAFPIAYSLFKKGAALSVVFTYIGASAVCRIPMTVFEASLFGLKFTIIRLSVSLPLVIISSILLGRYLKSKKYEINEA